MNPLVVKGWNDSASREMEEENAIVLALIQTFTNR
jgi:hypothetical protein